MVGSAKFRRIGMRKDFEDCVKNGGRLRIKQLKNNKSIRICYDKEGNSFSGGITVGKPVEDNKEKKVEQHQQHQQQQQQQQQRQQQVDMSKSLSEKLIELQNHINTHYHT
jgi:transcription initiation factor TFIID subunit TAF12